MALGAITLGQGTLLSTAGDSSFGNGSGGSVSIRGGQFIATGSQILTSPAFGSIGEGGSVMIAAKGNISLMNLTVDSSSPLGNGGAVVITAPIVSLENSTILTGVLGDGITLTTGSGGAVTLMGTTNLSLTGSTIDTSVFETQGNAGPSNPSRSYDRTEGRRY